jgi:Flp pilus assembly protein TadG
MKWYPMFRQSLMSKKALVLAKLKELRKQDAASLVEAALVLAFFGPLLLLGTFEMGGLIYASIEVSDAAHAAATYAVPYYLANSGAALPSQAEVTSAAKNDAPELLNMLKSGTDLTATIATGCGTGNASTGNSLPNCAAGTMPYVQVTASATVSPMVQFFSFFESPTLAARAKIDLVD